MGYARAFEGVNAVVGGVLSLLPVYLAVLLSKGMRQVVGLVRRNCSVASVNGSRGRRPLERCWRC